MKKIILKLFRRLRDFNNKNLMRLTETNTFLLAGLHIKKIKELQGISSLKEVEFRVFSESGEDGIIQYLINNIEIKNKVFVEFGVEDYKEANTRFLLMGDNWKGLVIDSGKENISSIKKDEIYYKYDLTAINAFIIRENINDLISKAGFVGEIGLLSIDIDGNDYWVWEALNVINPAIVICEYNSLFGVTFPVSTPYDANFNRTKAHFSNLYFGASLLAIVELAEKKGYDFIGSNTRGSNAFFVKKVLSSGLKRCSAEEGYIQSQFRQSRDKEGNLTFLNWEESRKIISDMKVINTETGEMITLGEIF